MRGDDLSYVMESEAGTQLRLGSVARATGANQSLVEIEDLVEYFSITTMSEVTDTLPDNSVDSVVELFHFEAANLAAVGDSVRVVLPLQAPLEAGVMV